MGLGGIGKTTAPCKSDTKKHVVSEVRGGGCLSQIGDVIEWQREQGCQGTGTHPQPNGTGPTCIVYCIIVLFSAKLRIPFNLFCIES